MQLTREETEAASAVEIAGITMKHRDCGGTFHVDEEGSLPTVRCDVCGLRLLVTGMWVATRRLTAEDIMADSAAIERRCKDDPRLAEDLAAETL